MMSIKTLCLVLLYSTASWSFSIVTTEKCIGELPCGQCTEKYPGGVELNYYTPPMFYDMWKTGQCDFVLDVRPAEAYEAGHVQGAFNAPGLAGGIENLPSEYEMCKEQVICVHCRTGRLARMAAVHLKDAGFKYLHILGQGPLTEEEDVAGYPCNAGFPDWQTAGYPTSTGPQTGYPQC